MDWLAGNNCWSGTRNLRNVSSLSIWGLGAHHVGNYDGLQQSMFHSLHNQLKAFVRLRHENEHWASLANLGLHITDSNSRQDLFDFVNELFNLEPTGNLKGNLKSLNISIESDNGGVMSIYPTTRYRPPEVGLYETLIKKTQEIYDVDYKTARSALNSLGQLAASNIREKFEEFEDVHREFTSVMFDLLWTYGILFTLMRDTTQFEALHARGFEEHLRNTDILRLEVAKFAVYF